MSTRLRCHECGTVQPDGPEEARGAGELALCRACGGELRPETAALIPGNSSDRWRLALRDAGRLAAVRASNLVDAVTDAGFDRISSLAARIVGAPVSMVSLLEADEEVVTGAFGLPASWGGDRRLPLSCSLAVHVVAQGAPLVISDTREDPIHRHNSAIDELGVVAYAGVPLATGDGHVLGSLAVIDSVPREWSRSEIDQLRALAELALANIDLRREASKATSLWRTVIGERDAAELECARLRSDVKGLEVLLDVSHHLGARPDARPGVCQAATELADASVALLWEPNADRTELVLTAEHGAELRPRRLPLHPGACAEADAFLGATSSFLATVEAGFAIHHSVLAAIDVASFALEPVIGDDGPLAVLEVAWQRGPDQIPPSAVAVVSLLSADAAAAIVRAGPTTPLSSVAQTDALTGLPNRRDWDEALPRELARAERLKYPVCVVIGNLDHSRRGGAGPGEATRDRLLAELAGAWRQELRQIDVLARTSGNELALILPGCASAQAVKVAGRLRRRTPDTLTASIGVADWEPQESVADLLARADGALSRARKKRNRTAIAPASDA